MNKQLYLLDEIETALDVTSRQILIDIIKQKQSE
jgi:ABC-type multidrug transport system ATPase subunit